ncbi:MAG TPA: hypothetical protein VMJ30_03645 [Gemmatimonadales bacterium]|nr:hypothetical protein [Gemmatimonadales bacterium]
MAQMGNHMKQTLPHDQRARAREFYAGLCGCRVMNSPRPDLDLYEFDGGFVVGLFFVDPADALPEAEYLKAGWLEIKVVDPASFRARVEALGVTAIPFEDTSRFYFHAPGGQVFRIAPMDGGV